MVTRYGQASTKRGNGYGGSGEKKKRPTYPQDWPPYRLAQNFEGEFFRQFLSDLMDLVREPQQTFGRPRHRISDVLKAMVLKVYSRMSAGRSKTSLRDANRFGYMEKVPSANAIIEYMNMPELTPIFQECIEYTGLVLRPYEVHFAPDSSGFRANFYQRWLEEKHGKRRVEDVEDEELIERRRREWRSVHIAVGVNSQVVVAARVGGGDYPHFIPMFERVRDLFHVERISADGGYTGHTNFEAAQKWGVKAFIPFDSRHVRPPDSDRSAWGKAYRFYDERPEEFDEGYHPRSLAETSFSSIKRLFDETVRSKKPDAQVNELLCKLLCHNIVVLIHEMFELGIYPFFATDPRFIDSLEDDDLEKLSGHRHMFVADGHWPADDDKFEHFQRPQQEPYRNGHRNGNGTGTVDPSALPHHMLESGW